MQEFKKSEIALLQIKGAITLLKNGNFVSALTLAGAGNEILSRMCRKRGLPWTHTFKVDDVEEINQLPAPKLERLLNQRINATRGSIKHHNKPEDDTVIAEFFLEAVSFINASLENYKILFGMYPEGEEVRYFFTEITKSV